jgi:hypothetical protein
MRLGEEICTIDVDTLELTLDTLMPVEEAVAAIRNPLRAKLDPQNHVIPGL